MTVAERPPIYLPSGKGWKASYALTFTTDLVHEIYLLGAIQGSPIAAKTLSVDNTANGSACQVNIRGATSIVPPYALAYIDCAEQMNVQITAGAAAATIAVDVLTYVVAESIIAKKVANVGGQPPISVVGSFTVNPGSVNIPTKILSLGAGITSYLTLTCTGANLYFGFTSAVNVGGGVSGAAININMDSNLQELWVKADALSLVSWSGG